MAAGEAFGLFVLYGSIAYPQTADQLPTSTDGCQFNSTAFYALNDAYTGAVNGYEEDNFFFRIFHIAFLLVPVSGFFISYFIGLFASLATGGLKRVNQVNPLHLNPIAWYIWPSSCVPLTRREDFKVGVEVHMNVQGNIERFSM